MPRKQKKYHFIYKTTNLVNGKFYVGMHSTDDLEDGYFGSGKILQYSVSKHGIENHQVEILEFLSSREELKKREAEVVNGALLAHPLCMNLKFGGEGGWDHILTDPRKLSEVQALRSKAGNLAFTEKMKKDETFKELFSSKVSAGNINRKGKAPKASFTGRTHSDETLEKMRKPKNLGESNSQFGLRWIHSKELKCSKRIKKSDPLPEGWQEGRKMKFM